MDREKDFKFHVNKKEKKMESRESRILKLNISNIKGIKVVELVPNGENMVFKGVNGAGKSSAIAALRYAFKGGRARGMLRNGEDKGEIIVETDRYVIKKVVTEKGDRLEVFSLEGAKFPSPQDLLNTMIGDLTFDPLKFANLSKKEQADALLKTAGIDLEQFNNEKKELYDRRTDKNREVKKLEVSIGEPPPVDVSTEEMSMSAQLEIVRGLEAKRTAYGVAVFERKDREETISKLEQEIKERVERIEILKGAQTELPEQVTENDVEVERSKLNSIESHNNEVKEAKKYRETKAELDLATSEAEELTQKIQTVERAKEEQVRNIKLPVDGLFVTEDGVTFKGIDFSGLSTGEQVRISTAIAMDLNPKLRILFIRDGSNLDDEGFAEIVRLAKEHEYQVFIERVEGAVEVEGKMVYPKVGIYFEEGEIVAVDGNAVVKTTEESVIEE